MKPKHSLDSLLGPITNPVEHPVPGYTQRSLSPELEARVRAKVRAGLDRKMAEQIVFNEAAQDEIRAVDPVAAMTAILPHLQRQSNY